VVIVGAGLAGLTATLKLAELATTTSPHHLLPLTILLIEAHSFVGGRTRTILTDNTTNNHQQQQQSPPIGTDQERNNKNNNNQRTII